MEFLVHSKCIPQHIKQFLPFAHSKLTHSHINMVTYNFGAGPATLPKQVLQQASQAVIDYNNTGLSILEIGHRTHLFQDIIHEAQALVKELMQLDADHEVLFLHGGASTQFFQVPMNLLNEKDTAAYIDTGIWASKAIKEARLYGNVEVVASSKHKQYTYIPKQFNISQQTSFLHFTTNNTVEGTQWHTMPAKKGALLVADMSSDILSRQLNFNRFDLIYAAAQKNIGAAGVSMVVVNKNILDKVSRSIPTLLNYQQHITAKYILNTPPVFAIYTCLLNLRWLKAQGGIAYIEKINNAKAALLYNTLDAFPLFKTIVNKEDRSNMNICFFIENATLEKQFATLCAKENIVGIKGHRTVGGFRVSLYNAVPISAVQILVDVIKKFINM